MSPLRQKIERPLKAMLSDLSMKELREAADFVFFLKTRSIINPAQAYFWTRRWQTMEKRADKDRHRGKIIGKGSLGSLLRALHA